MNTKLLGKEVNNIVHKFMNLEQVIFVDSVCLQVFTLLAMIAQKKLHANMITICNVFKQSP
jgi:queuine/archaeosine tRNA-ribosyltransferase